MRILVVTTSYPRRPGDWAGRFVRDLNAGFVALGNEVTTLAPWAPGLAIEEDDAEAGPVRRVRGRDERSAALFYGAGAESNARGLGAFRTVAAFRDLSRAFEGALADALPGADLVVAHWTFPSAWWAAGAAPRAPLAGIVHGADARLLSRPLIGRAAAARLRGTLDAAVCVSSATWRRIGPRLRVPRDRVVISPMGIDSGVFARGAPSRAAPDLVVAAGRLVPAKGFDLLIRACAGLGVEVVIAGEGPEREALARLAAGSRVRLGLPGTLPPEALAALFRRAGVVCVPSRGRAREGGEGVPMVAIEALACGAAVVATETGGLPEVLAPHALGAADPASLRDSIRAALAAPDRFRDPAAATRFDRVAVAARILRGIGAGSSRRAAPRRRAASLTGCSAPTGRP